MIWWSEETGGGGGGGGDCCKGRLVGTLAIDVGFS